MTQTGDKKQGLNGPEKIVLPDQAARPGPGQALCFITDLGSLIKRRPGPQQNFYSGNAIFRMFNPGILARIGPALVFCAELERSLALSTPGVITFYSLCNV